MGPSVHTGTMTNSEHTIVFDLDGTLVDTAPDLIGTLSWLLEAEGLDPVDLDAARDLIGHGMKPMIEKALRRQGRGQTTDEVEAVYGRYVAAYEARISRESRPFPHILDALDRLASEGFRLAVCTNKIERLAVLLLDQLGMRTRFSVVTGADTFSVRKPHPDHLLLTIDRAGGDRSKAVMIGDSETDIATAQAAGLPVVAYAGGYTAVPLPQLNPDVILDTYADLVPTLHRLFQRTVA